MLEEKLISLLSQVGEDRLNNLNLAKNWFDKNPTLVAQDLEDLSYICELDPKERHLVSYPLVAMWNANQVQNFNLENETENQKVIKDMFSELMLYKRFSNNHWEESLNYFEYGEKIRDIIEDMESLFINNPKELRPIFEFINRGLFSSCTDFKSSTKRKVERKIDIGHGLQGPIMELSNNFFFDIEQELEGTKKSYGNLGLSLMVVDDKMPEFWYKRTLKGGFKEVEGQQGYFYDCESAIKALENNERYDIILTDIELGEGKMDGYDFILKTNELLTSKNEKSLFSLFSFNQIRIHDINIKFNETKRPEFLISDVGSENMFKRTFNPFSFRQEVIKKLYYLNQ